MSNSNTARANGDDYQGMVFWKYVNSMMAPDSEIESICYEYNEIKSFDDIVVLYKNKQKFRDGNISHDYIQVKFHVKQTSVFSIDNLLDPSFINATKNSLMDNIVLAYKKLGQGFKNKRFIIYTMWQIDQKDDLYKMIRNVDCSFDIVRIFDGTSEKSKMGKIRKKFCEKLNIKEHELKDILTQTCIYSGREDIVEIKECVNRELKYNGLKAWPDSKSTNPYWDMIRFWMKSGIKEFNKDFILEECKNEGLLVNITKASVIAIRSFIPYTDNIIKESEDYLDLVEYFNGRFLKNGLSWETIYCNLREYAERLLKNKLEYHIHLPTHLTIAFMAGRIMNSKSGITTKPFQNTVNGNLLWSIDNDSEIMYEELKVTSEVLDESSYDTAIAISISNTINDAVSEYISERGLSIGTIYFCSLEEPDNNSVIDGKHAWQIARQLNSLINKRTSKQKCGILHVFVSGPASIMFYLGKLSLSYGQIQFYEFDFQRLVSGTYYPTGRLPMEGDN